MMARADSILDVLKKKGFRMTGARKALLRMLDTSTTPLSAPEILAKLKQSISTVNKTTVYRELEFLHDQGIVHEVDLLEGMKRYELFAGGSHHHHAVCTKCHSIQCVQMDHDLDLIEQRLKKSLGFEVHTHSLEFFGLCEKCRGL